MLSFTSPAAAAAAAQTAGPSVPIEGAGALNVKLFDRFVTALLKYMSVLFCLLFLSLPLLIETLTTIQQECVQPDRQLHRSGSAEQIGVRQLAAACPVRA